MELTRRLRPFADRDCVVTIGSFDGMHVGHRALIRRLLEHGRRLELPAMLLSFEPLPREYLQPSDPPARLTNFRERWRLLEASGLERLCLLRFDERLRALTGLQFMQLLRAARARVVVVGHDFRFGRGGEASAQWCAAHAAPFGFEVEVMAPVCIDHARVSSGLVRAALQRAEFDSVRALLGRPYGMRGRVRAGNRLGRELGFPTANIAVKRRRVPLTGVFAVRVHGLPAGVGGAAEGRAGVANLGERPMVGGGRMLLEAHVFDYAADLYGRELEVEFVAKLREERRFDSLAAMVVQMRRDAAEARLLGSPEPGTAAGAEGARRRQG